MAAAHEQSDHIDSESSTAVAAPPQPKSTPSRVDQLPPWQVLLHNDNHNTVGHVVRSVQKLIHLPAREALMRTMEADTRGIALLMETHREHAELLVEQFATFKLTVTAEPAHR